jgi:hypothetical protein
MLMSENSYLIRISLVPPLYGHRAMKMIASWVGERPSVGPPGLAHRKKMEAAAARLWTTTPHHVAK